MDGHRTTHWSSPGPLGLALLTALLGGCMFAAPDDSRWGQPDIAPRPDAGVVPDASRRDTWRPVCTAGETTCEDLLLKVCAGGGDGWIVSTCPPGSGCVAGACEVAHPRVLFIFDTSSSMLGAANGELPSDAPECGSIEADTSRIALSKALFRELFAAPLSTAPRMGLMRFPQVAVAAPECDAAAYVGRGRITGDDGSHRAPEDRGEWFRRGLPEALVVGLSSRVGEDGREAIGRWLDGSEVVKPTGESCTELAECPGGFCGGGACHRYLDPELRAGGNTPLGRSLFYAGEYYRIAVFVDGRPCESDGACASPGYRCGDDGRCYDPLASCRTNHIVVFSDGQETNDTSPESFFHPLNQARRLRYGLSCATDADCQGGAACTRAGRCVPSDPLPAVGDEVTLAVALGYVDAEEGVDRLTRADGEPASIQVHVLDVWGSPDNALLAWAGGGQYVVGSVAQPTEVLLAMDLLFRSKGATGVCRPLD